MIRFCEGLKRGDERDGGERGEIEREREEKIERERTQSEREGGKTREE